eukprot:6176965-Pleurochrysis_carterae.AAC.1
MIALDWHSVEISPEHGGNRGSTSYNFNYHLIASARTTSTRLKPCSSLFDEFRASTHRLAPATRRNSRLCTSSRIYQFECSNGIYQDWLQPTTMGRSQFGLKLRWLNRPQYQIPTKQLKHYTIINELELKKQISGTVKKGVITPGAWLSCHTSVISHNAFQF